MNPPNLSHPRFSRRTRQSTPDTERQIALMHEYCSRLTEDWLTVQLDVRPAAAKLPTLPDETAADALDERDIMVETEPEKSEPCPTPPIPS